MDTIDELVQRWKQNPSPTTTVALCEALRERPRGPLVQQVGEFATQRHAGDVKVLVSVARMYMETRRFAEAQTVLVAAGKQAPRDGDVYRWLGEVLLRRGDADRAERVLQRAIHLGSQDPQARPLLERARNLRPMQATAGARAVAAEVAQETALPGRDLFDSMSENTTDINLLSLPNVSEPEAPIATELPRLVERSPAPQAATGRTATNAAALAVAPPLPTGPAVPVPLLRVREPAAPGPGANGGAAAMASRRERAAAMTLPEPPTSGVVVPHPRDVLDALALSGVYEPQASTVRAAWDRAGKGPKRRGGPTLVTGMVLFLAGSVGTYYAYRHKRAQDHMQAEGLLATVESQLQAGKPESLPEVETTLRQALELESRSPRAALDWTRERAVVGLVKSGADVAFEDAMARAKEVGVPEEKYAFARVASFLFQGDNAGAVAVLPRWDGPAGGDAFYQLVAGATLERAGDARDRDRYAAAVKIDPELVVAQVGVARSAAFEGDPQEAMRMAKALRARWPDRAEPVALVALAWGRDPLRDEGRPPPEVDDVSKRAAELPTGLKFVPHAVEALRALDRHAAADAQAEIRKGLAVAESPGAAVWLGAIALPLEDEALARSAALAALQLSAVFEPARALAARVALLGGRLDEALKATEELDPTSPDVAVVRGAAAYERVDPDGLARALDALPASSRKLPLLAALSTAPDVLAGAAQPDAAKLLALAGEDDPWSDLVAMDIALDGGALAVAEKIAAAWGKGAESRPLRALRLARIARYEGRLEEADGLSQAVLDHGTVTPRALWERIFDLVARGRAAEVAPMIARYPLVLGPLATWVSAYASAAAGNVEAAKGKTAAIDPPPSSAPLEVRVIAAAALGAMKDRRRGAEYVRSVLSTGSLHPDLVAAALALGLHRVEHGRRRVTYE